MSYSRNFGMRSFENVVRDGRFRVPKAGTPLLIGSPVALDTANPGFLRLATAAEAPSPLTGVVVFEHIQFKGVDTFLTTNVDAPFNRVPLGQYAQMMHGVGTKVWLKNTTTSALYDGRSQEGVTMYTGPVAVGDTLVPAGDGTYRVGADGEAGWLFVEQSNPDTGLVEARFNF
jgi:hypothetical protein